jgi:DNA-binding Lrp family transcriptional regulator
MDDVDRKIVNALQGGFPVSPRPFAEAGAALGLSEDELIARLRRLTTSGALSRFGPLWNAERMGGAVTLAAMAVPRERFDEVAAIVNAKPEVAHNYERAHALNMWFVVSVEDPRRIGGVLSEIKAATGIEVYDFPKLAEYFLELKLAA